MISDGSVFIYSLVTSRFAVPFRSVFYTVPLFYQQDSLSLSDICSCMRMSGIKDIPGECSSLHCCVPDEMRRRHFSLQVLTGYGQNAEQRWVMSGCQSTRHTVNSSPGQLVTQSTRHRSARHPVDSSRSRLVTSKHQSRTANNVLVPPTSWP